jgi:hypothetical protein
MARYNFISENDFNFANSPRSQASSTHFRGADLNYLACRYAIHRQLNPPAVAMPPETSEFFEDHYEEEGQRSGWLGRLFQRLATLGEAERPQG